MKVNDRVRTCEGRTGTLVEQCPNGTWMVQYDAKYDIDRLETFAEGDLRVIKRRTTTMAQTTTAAKTNPKAPAQSAKPGDPAPAAKKEKVVKVTYPGLKPGPDGKGTVKLKDFPTDFDAKAHKPLRRQDFESEAPFLNKRADELEARAKELRKQAEEAAKLGNAGDRQKAKRLRQMIEKVQEIRKQLLDQGVPEDMIPSLDMATADAKV